MVGYGTTFNYPIFGCVAKDIVFDLADLGGNPTALARMMLCWWKCSDWTALHDRIYKGLRQLCSGNRSDSDIRSLQNLLDQIQSDTPGKGKKTLIRLVVLVLQHVCDKIPAKQDLVVEILGELLGACRVTTINTSSKDRIFTRTCVFRADQLREVSLEYDLDSLRSYIPALEKINELYDLETQRIDLHNSQALVLSTFLTRFCRCTPDDVSDAMRRMKHVRISQLWKHFQALKAGPTKKMIFDDPTIHRRVRIALTEGSYDDIGVCGICWLLQQRKELLGDVDLVCRAHKKIEEKKSGPASFCSGDVMIFGDPDPRAEVKAQVLSTYLGVYLRCTEREVRSICSRMPMVTLAYLWGHLYRIRLGQVPERSLFETQELENRVKDSLFKGGPMTDGFCATCFLALQDGLDNLDMIFECPLHNRKIDQVLPMPVVKEQTVDKMNEEAGERQIGFQVPVERKNSIEEESIQKEGKALECVVCFGPLNCALIPCGHLCCMECGKKMEVCPICRMAISTRHRIYLP